MKFEIDCRLKLEKNLSKVRIINKENIGDIVFLTNFLILDKNNCQILSEN